MKSLSYFITLFLIIFFLGSSLNPLSNNAFIFHDNTQATRVHQFALNLNTFHIPPRIAPDVSFHLGYPLFNYYAPFSYWVTSLIHLVGIDIATSLKLSFLLALTLAFTGMYLFLRIHFPLIPSLLGGVLYASSPYMATEIFVRGNLAETWFIALLPLILLLLHQNSMASSKKTFIATTLVCSFILTVHNIFSLLFIPIGLLYILLLKNRKKNIMSVILAFFIGAYFIIPAIGESPFIAAQEVAKQTNFRDHFLCWWQLWKTPLWGYGGSAPGCVEDGMAFMLGKIHIVIGIFGMASLLISLQKHKEYKTEKLAIFFFLVSIVSTFLTTYTAQPVWERLASILSLFQFPWRFLVFSIFGLAFFSAYTFSSSRLKYFVWAVPIIILMVLISGSKYFKKTEMTTNQFNNTYASQDFIAHKAAYNVPEYLPRTVEKQYWLTLEPSQNGVRKVDPLLVTNMPVVAKDKKEVKIIKNEPFLKEVKTNSSQLVLNIHYLPYWNIMINNATFIPQQLDPLGRPIISQSGDKIIRILYQQTPIEKRANIITLIALITLFTMVYSAYLWKKIN